MSYEKITLTADSREELDDLFVEHCNAYESVRIIGRKNEREMTISVGRLKSERRGHMPATSPRRGSELDGPISLGRFMDVQDGKADGAAFVVDVVWAICGGIKRLFTKK